MQSRRNLKRLHYYFPAGSLLSSSNAVISRPHRCQLETVSTTTEPCAGRRLRAARLSAAGSSFNVIGVADTDSFPLCDYVLIVLIEDVLRQCSSSASSL